MTKPSASRVIRGYLWIALASALYALSFDWFYAPNQLGFGGLTALGMILNHLSPAIPIGTSVLALNIPIFLLGWKFLGGHALVSSLFAMTATSLLVDLLAALYLPFAWLPMGKLMLAVDLTMLLAVSAVFRSLESAMYGIIALYITTAVMDQVLYGLDRSKVAYIVTANPRPMAAEIDRQLDRGVTYLHGEGSFSGQDKLVLMCAFKQRQIVPLKALVHALDPEAFLIVCDAHEVLGQGFRRYQKNSL